MNHEQIGYEEKRANTILAYMQTMNILCDFVRKGNHFMDSKELKEWISIEISIRNKIIELTNEG